MFSLIILAVLSSCRAENDALNAFQELSEMNEKWLQATSIPEAAILLRHPPYSYHSKNLALNENFSEFSLMKNETENFTTPEGEIKSCSDDMAQIIYNLKSSWARQMLDSDGKISSGILRGGLIWPGHFEECNSAYAPKDDKGQGDFHGKYCVLSWTMNISAEYSKLPLSVGICVPDSCTERGLKTAGGNVIKILERLPILKNHQSLLTLKEVTCKLKEKELDIGSIIYVVFVSCFVILVVVGSAVTVIHNLKKQRTGNIPYSQQRNIQISEGYSDISEASAINAQQKSYEACHDKDSLIQNPELGVTSIQRKSNNSIAKKILLCFSAIENGKKILNTKTSEDQLLSVHGIRFLSLTWVILGHTYISSISVIGNRIDVLKEMDSVSFQVLLQAPFSVDSFFLLGGFLLAYLFLKEADRKNGKINWLYFYMHRIWRLTPAYMVVVFFYIFVFKYIGSGPFWDDKHCDNNHGDWWKYLLYINNFIPIHDMCLGWSWYLANDMQFYIISPLFLYPLWRWPPIGLSILASILIATWTTTGILSYTYDLIPMFVGVTQTKDFDAYATKMWDSFDLIYDKPYCRIAPYIIGVFLGFILHKLNKRRNFMTWMQQILGWTIAAFCSLSVVFGLYHVKMSKTTALFYNSLCRSAFSVGLAWIILICETGHGGFITKFLSWKFFLPLSRLSYCTYLVHPILIHAYYQAYPAAFHFTQYLMVTNFMGFLIMAYGIAFMFSLVFESPLMNLEKLMLKIFKDKH
ncbi:nose resistant to fluoxetine protein 6 [Nephila pilipes]|uniref:Nose resistant to fluoxetine protein 6 n=1 Tax=Nephila pilipes TaxID=299642 RepID=A0A8X6Q605_NEPPI|nr:nose resistant to fluoxetine protein 6 [Nephila pilipes]